MADDLGSKTVLELKSMLREQSLPVSGNKQELINRLQENQSSASTNTSAQTPTFNLKDIDWKNEKTQTIVAAIVLLIFIPIVALSSNSWAYASSEETYDSWGGEVKQELKLDFGLSDAEFRMIINGEEIQSDTLEFEECETEVPICTTLAQAGGTTYFFYIIAMICMVVFLATSIIQMTNTSKKVEQLKWFATYEDKTILVSKMLSAGLLLFATIWYPLKIFLDDEDDTLLEFDSTGLGLMWWIMLVFSLTWFWLVYAESIKERWIPWIKQKIGK